MVLILTDLSDLQLESGKLCLDFANTADWHASSHPEEELNSYTDLVAWSRRVGLADETEARCLQQAAENRPEQAGAILGKAIELREAIYRIFAARSAGLPVEECDLAVLNAALSEALPHRQLMNQEHRFTWVWAGPADRLDWMLWPVALSASELLASATLDRVGQCADDRGCGWLFFDASRNRSRRWCDMKDCGNRAKARRHYQRVKSE